MVFYEYIVSRFLAWTTGCDASRARSNAPDVSKRIFEALAVEMSLLSESVVEGRVSSWAPLGSYR